MFHLLKNPANYYKQFLVVISLSASLLISTFTFSQVSPTSAEERMKWAVLDMHHYHAWGGECRGSVEGPPTGSYACADDEAKAMVFKKCADWPFAFRGAMESECGKGLRLASAEFSAATHQYVLCFH